MGILNLTPDSFSDGGRYLRPGDAVRRAEALASEGADLIDVGAESTRPGAAPVPPDEEWRRLAEVLPALRGLPAVLSIDTLHPEVARRAADAGAALLNLPFPAAFAAHGGGPDLCLRFSGVVLMHARGTPETMTTLCHYDDLLGTIAAELRAVTAALGLAGHTDRVLYDPGLGFAKTAAQSLALLGSLAALGRTLGRPLLVGASRKSFLGHATGLPTPERLVPSVAAAVLAAIQGAAVVRVHDVAQTRAALQVVEAARSAAAAAGGAP